MSQLERRYSYHFHFPLYVLITANRWRYRKCLNNVNFFPIFTFKLSNQLLTKDFLPNKKTLKHQHCNIYFKVSKTILRYDSMIKAPIHTKVLTVISSWRRNSIVLFCEAVPQYFKFNITSWCISQNGQQFSLNLS